MKGRGIRSHFCIQSDDYNTSVGPLPQSSPCYLQPHKWCATLLWPKRKVFMNISQSLFWLLTNTQHYLCFCIYHRGKVNWILSGKEEFHPLTCWITQHEIIFPIGAQSIECRIFFADNSEFFEIAKTMLVKPVTVQIFLNVSLLGCFTCLSVLPTDE